MQHIAVDYNVTKSKILESIKWVEQTLIKSGVFNLLSKRKLYSDICIEVVLIDATEVEIEYPKKTKTLLLRKKEKAHIKSSNSNK